MTERPTERRRARAKPNETAAGKARAPLPPMPKKGWWEERVSLPPRKGYVYERADKPGADGIPPLYVRQHTPERGNWQRASLGGTLYDDAGKRLAGDALKARQDWARLAAAEQLQRWENARRGIVTPKAATPARPVTLGELPLVLTHPDTGKFPAANGKPKLAHAKEVLRSLAFAARVLGADRAVQDLGLDELTTLWRRRIREVAAADHEAVGLRAAEIVIRDVLSTANWLRERKRIPMGAVVAPRSWRQMLRADWVQERGKALQVVAPPDPFRPRHSEDDLRAILKAAWQVDPRFGLLLELGAELRGGQVKRVKRSDVALDVQPHGRVTVYGAGRKSAKGTAVKLTKGQRAKLERELGRIDAARGYLRQLEAAYRRGEVKDYLLFPAGQLPGGRKGEDPVADPTRHAATGYLSSRTLLEWFHEAEALAQVAPVEGGALYMLRRAGVDAFKRRKGSREALQEHGGWADTQIPDTVYADEQREYAQDEAAEIRAKIRGEDADG